MDEEVKQEAAPVEEPKIDDFNVRANTFVKEYGELVEKHKVDFATYPMFAPDGNGGFKIVVQNQPVDMTKIAQKSPFVAKE